MPLWWLQIFLAMTCSPSHIQGRLNSNVGTCDRLWFTRGIPVSSTNKTDHHDITEILLKVALTTITLTLFACSDDSFFLLQSPQCYHIFSLIYEQCRVNAWVRWAVALGPHELIYACCVRHVFNAFLTLIVPVSCWATIRNGNSISVDFPEEKN
jgi:hypothetical protein